ncbi:MAG: HK97-gp10 family putative phage morphogenesis protein [Telluria sp.]
MADEIIKGGKELDAFLKSLPAKVEQNILRSALRAGANEFKKEAKVNIPVVEGDLLASARVSTRAKKGRVTVSFKIGGKRAPHAHLVEFGTKPHKIAPKGAGGLLIGGNVVGAVDHPGSKPHPIMRPAFDSKSTEAITAVGLQIRKRLTKEGINVPAPEAE